MLEEIVEKYRQFADATIEEISYTPSNGYTKKNIGIIIIKCRNRKENDNWESIKISFIDMLNFKFIGGDDVNSTIINAALIKQVGNLIIFDFFPIYYSKDIFIENPNSDFSIHCKAIKYEVIE